MHKTLIPKWQRRQQDRSRTPRGAQVEPLLEVLVGQALERALAEALEERELAALRARQAAYQQAHAGWRSF